MPEPNQNKEQAIRETAYHMWEREGRAEGLAKTIGGVRSSSGSVRSTAERLN
jgi:hypothetical protein